MSLDTGSPVADRLNGHHRTRFLLSGLLRCGGCGGGYRIIGKDRYGCATRRAKGLCDNSHAIQRQRIEDRAMKALQHQMLQPAMVDAFVSAFNAEASALSRQAVAHEGHAAKELADVQRKLGFLVRAVEEGEWNESLRSRMTDLEQRRAALKARIAAATVPPPKVVLHPNVSALYSEKVANLRAALTDPAVQPEATEILRGLMERIVLTPDADEPDGLRAELHGDLAVLLRLAEGTLPAARKTTATSGGGTCVPVSLLSVVAGTGFEPVTFRL